MEKYIEVTESDSEMEITQNLEGTESISESASESQCQSQYWFSYPISGYDQSDFKYSTLDKIFQFACWFSDEIIYVCISLVT